MGCATTQNKAQGLPRLSAQHVGGKPRFQAVSVVNEAVVWVSGTDGQFARSLDGGQTWQKGQVKGGESLQFRDVHAVNEQVAYLMSAGEGTASRIYKTIDGGKTWEMQFQNAAPEGFYDCIAFWDGEKGLGFSDSVQGTFPIVRTENGGKAWEFVPSEKIPAALKGEGAFAASGTCLTTQKGGFGWLATGASSIKARVLRTTDYGQSWQAAETPIVSDSPTAGINSLVFLNAAQGFAFGGDFSKDVPPPNRVAATEDGGKTWGLLPNPPLQGSIFGAAHLTSTNTIVIVGPKGANYSTDLGKTWNPLSETDFWSIGCAPKACWLVGPQERIVKLTF